ncbi:hypothetical protein DFH09DRAFT_1082716 [Mycena vulgaris]|nr:hypothetical protein DFH09DRAFT_1082716 [Mycena vulgaris]
MAAPRKTALKQVGKLFNEALATLAAIRDETPDNEDIKPKAIVWLKAAGNRSECHFSGTIFTTTNLKVARYALVATLLGKPGSACIFQQMPSQQFQKEQSENEALECRHEMPRLGGPPSLAALGGSPEPGHLMVGPLRAHEGNKQSARVDEPVASTIAKPSWDVSDPFPFTFRPNWRLKIHPKSPKPRMSRTNSFNSRKERGTSANRPTADLPPPISRACSRTQGKRTMRGDRARATAANQRRVKSGALPGLRKRKATTKAHEPGSACSQCPANMATPSEPFDLKQVGKLFNDTLSVIRDETPDNESLIPEAIVWLKAARTEIMRQIEAGYYELERSRRSPLLQPKWVDPSQKLVIFTQKIPTVLKPFAVAFVQNLDALMRACDLQNCETVYWFDDSILVRIRFPAQLASPSSHGIPRTLNVEDEFSQSTWDDQNPRTGGFTATKFTRLLMDARGEGVSSSQSVPLPTATRDSDNVADESDEGELHVDVQWQLQIHFDLYSREKKRRQKGRKSIKKKEEARESHFVLAGMKSHLVAGALFAAVVICLVCALSLRYPSPIGLGSNGWLRSMFI